MLENQVYYIGILKIKNYRFADDQFTEKYIATIGVDFRFKTL